MEFVAIRPKKRKRRLKAGSALYTVAFDLGELRRHDSSFDLFCHNDCIHGRLAECGEKCYECGEFGRLRFLWNQDGYLIRYFKNVSKYLDTERYGYIGIREAITHHHDLADSIIEHLLTGDLSQLFVPLYKNGSKTANHPELKFKSDPHFEEYNNWIRIYALRYVDDDNVCNYIITGGGIKVFGKMSDNAVTEYEEDKMNLVIDYLIEKGISTREQIETLVL